MQNIEDILRESFTHEKVKTIGLLNHIEEFISPFTVYLMELKRWNRAYNLTSIEDEKEIVIKHFVDSLLYISFVPEEILTVADVGSGAGFPGVPIAIVRPTVEITLIEPSWKKSAFLKNIKYKLKLTNVEILQARAQEVSKKFDIVVSRALWSIKDFIKNCSHLIKEGGFLLISKSVKIDEELKEVGSYAKIEIKDFVLPQPPDFLKELKRFIVKISI